MLLLIQLGCDGLWAWPWPILLAFLLGAILGWLLSKLFGGSSDGGDDYRQRYLDVKADLDACRKNANNSLAGAGALGATAGASSFTAKTVVDDSVKDDLTRIEGIGPKIAEHLNNDGIWSWKQLSESAVSRIQKVLDNAGPAYKVHNPGSWPKQALMCVNKEWDKLDKWQDDHKGGLE